MHTVDVWLSCFPKVFFNIFINDVSIFKYSIWSKSVAVRWGVRFVMDASVPEQPQPPQGLAAFISIFWTRADQNADALRSRQLLRISGVLKGRQGPLYLWLFAGSMVHLRTCSPSAWKLFPTPQRGGAWTTVTHLTGALLVAGILDSLTRVLTSHVAA